MELMNELVALESQISNGAMRDILEKLVLLLGPFAPYAAEEMWEELGHQGPVFRQEWPKYDPELARENEIEIVLQVNGKVRSRLTVPAGTKKDDLERIGLADEHLHRYTDGKQIVKVIAVPDKLVNVVVR
jgi:leucyl-tRNA synthetase